MTSAVAAAPERIGDGVISTIDDESGFVLAPDGASAYFVKRSPTTNTPPRSVICVTHRSGTRWSEPEIASFSGQYVDFGVAMSIDGRRLVFSSDRPNPSQTTGQDANVDLWSVEWTGDAWNEPQNLGAPINTAANDAYPSLAADGTLYFASGRPGGKGSADIYRARFVDGHYAEPENVGDINGAGYESQPAVAPDQSFIVFTSSGRDDTLAGGGAPYSRTDLYVAFRNGSGWSAPRNLGGGINTPANELTPSVSADARWLYFASDRSFAEVPMPRRLSTRDYLAKLHGIANGWGNIYRVPIADVERLRSAKGEHP